jgi:hypothetical protein
MSPRKLPTFNSKPWQDFFKKLRTSKPSEIFDFDSLTFQ